MRIKVCGITTAADAALAAALGADAIGLNFYAQSPRGIDLTCAHAIVRALPPFVEPVGVFVHPTAEQLQRCSSRLALRTVQLHAVSPSEWADLTSASYAVLLAHGVRDRESLPQLRFALAAWREVGVSPAGVLVDAAVPGLHGGTGQTAPWDLLADFDPGVPLILAGGLTPENVAEAIRLIRPYGVDVASGVERTPGVKDAEKLRRFIATAREAAAKYIGC